jgi:hippurate hydrolase
MDLADLYRDLHAHPELSFAEHRTAATAAALARDAGCEVTEGVGGTGVVAVLHNGDGPTVMLRADMDALPVAEATGLPYASVEPEVMHACGHDMHVTWLVGALEALRRNASAWSGTIMGVFQPAEEYAAGARAMVEDGLFDRFGRPDVVLGQHVAPWPAGEVRYRSGTTMAGMDSLAIRLFGQGGHGSRPETTVDPVVMAAATVLRLQTVVSREISGLDQAVLTIGSLHAGTKSNIIPAEAELQLSMRTFDAAVRQRMLDAIGRIVRAEAAASGATKEPDIEITITTPMLVNDPAATERAMAAIGADLTVVETPPAMASEDFGVLGAAAGVPSCYWFLGGTHDGGPSNHSPQFAPVLEPTIGAGVRAFVTAARAWLGR